MPDANSPVANFNKYIAAEDEGMTTIQRKRTRESNKRSDDRQEVAQRWKALHMIGTIYMVLPTGCLTMAESTVTTITRAWP